MINKDDGVSPVVGVMLMLSVTVIIAAVVSAAAGGLSVSEKKAPSAILDVHFYEARDFGGYTAPDMTIEHVSGNPLQTRDLTLITLLRNASGFQKGTLTGEHSIAGNDTFKEFTSGKYCGILFINDAKLGDPIQDSDSGYKSWFGNTSAVFKAGDILTSPARFSEPDVLPGGKPRQPNQGLDELLGLDCLNDPVFRAGSVINVKIVHIPSGYVIFDKDVVVV